VPRSAAIPRPTVETGMLLMAAAMLIVPSLDAFAKLLAQTLSPGEVVFGRFAMQTVCIAPLLLIGRARARAALSQPVAIHASGRLPRLAFQALGGTLIAAAVMLLVWALQTMPIANAIAIFFVEPLILTLFSAVLLREQVGWRRLAAVAVGLVGALIVIRPNWSEFGWASLLPLGTATCFAGYLTITRHMAQTGDRVRLQFWLGLFAALSLGIALLVGDAAGVAVLAIAWPAPWQLGVLAGMGAVSAVTHLLISQAFGRAPAAVLAPFQYLEIISATILGLAMFGDFPDAITWLGTAVIVGAGLYVFQRERTLARRPAPPPVV